MVNVEEILTHIQESDRTAQISLRAQQGLDRARSSIAR